MVDDPESVARARQKRAHAVLDIGAVESARAFHRPIARGEDHRVAAPRMDRVTGGLRAGPVLDEQEIAAGVIGSGLL